MKKKIATLLIYYFILISCLSNYESKNLDIFNTSETLFSKKENKPQRPKTYEERLNYYSALEADSTVQKIMTKDPYIRNGYDNTIFPLKILEDTNCSWEFFVYHSSSLARAKYYKQNLFKTSFKYQRLANTDHKQESSNTIIHFEDNTHIHILNDFFISPVNGKRKYSKYSPKKLLVHKRLPVRNGCFIKMKMPNDHSRFFRDQFQKFFISLIVVPKDLEEETVYLSLINYRNGDRLVLKNTQNKHLDELWTKHYGLEEKKGTKNPVGILKTHHGLKRSTYYLHYLGTFSELGLLTGIIAGLGYGFSDLVSDYADQPNGNTLDLKFPKKPENNFLNTYPEETDKILNKPKLPEPLTAPLDPDEQGGPFAASLANDFASYTPSIPHQNIIPEDIHKKIITYFEKRSSIWDVLGLIRPNNNLPTQDDLNTFFSSIADKLEIDEKYLSNDYIRLFIETEDIHNTIDQKNIQFKISSINGASSTESPSEIFNLNLRQKLDPASNTFTYQNLNTFDSDLSPSKIIDDQELLKNVNNDVKPTGLSKSINLPTPISENSLGNYLNQNESPITNYLNTRFNRIIENRTSADIDNSYAVHKIIKNDLIPLEREIERGLLLPENTLQHGENYSLTYEKNPQDSKVVFAFTYRINGTTITRNLAIDYNPSLAEDVVNSRPVPTLTPNPEIEAPTIDTNPIVEEEPFVASLANDFDSYRPSIPASNITPEDIHQKIITYFEKRSSIWDVLGLIRPNNNLPTQDDLNTFFSSIADKLEIDEKYLSNDYIRLFIETEDIHNTIDQKNIQFKISSINGASSTESPSEIFNLNLRQELDPASNTFTYQNLNTFDSDLSPSKIIDDQELLKNVNNDVKPTGLPKQISLPRHMSQNSLGNYLNQNESPITNYLNTRFNRIIENRTSPDIDNSYAVHKIIKNDLIPLEREIERGLLLPENTLQHGENYSLTYEKNPQDSKVVFSFAYRINEMNRTRYLEIDYEPSLAEDVVNNRPVPTLTPNPGIETPTIDATPTVEEPFMASLANDFDSYRPSITASNITPEDIHQKIITYFEKRSSIWDVLGLIRPNNSFPEQDEINDFFSSIADKLDIDEKYLSNDYIRLFIETEDIHNTINQKNIQFKISSINGASGTESPSEIFNLNLRQKLDPASNTFTYQNLNTFDSDLSPSKIIDDQELLKNVNNDVKPTGLPKQISLPRHMSQNSLGNYLNQNESPITNYLNTRFNRIIENRTSPDIDNSYAVHKIIKNDLIPLEKEIEKDLLLPENTLRHGENYSLTYEKNPQDSKVVFSFAYRINEMNRTRYLEIDYEPSLAEDVVNNRPVPTLNQNPEIEAPTIDTNPTVEEEPFLASLANDFDSYRPSIPASNITPEDIHQKIITYFEKRSSIWDVLELIRPKNNLLTQDEINDFFSSIADKLDIDEKYLSNDYIRLFIETEDIHNTIDQKNIQFKISSINGASSTESPSEIFNLNLRQKLDPASNTFTYQNLNTFDSDLSPSKIIDDQELLKNVNNDVKPTGLSKSINLPTPISENSLGNYLNQNESPITNYLNTRFNRIIENRTSPDIDNSYAVHKIIKNDLIPLEREIERGLLLPENTLQHGENYSLTYEKNPQDSKVVFSFAYRINEMNRTRYLEIDYEPSLAEDVVNNRPVPTLNQNPEIEAPTIDTNPIVEEEPFVASLANDFDSYRPSIPASNITPEDIHQKIITYFEKRSSIWDVLGLIRPNNNLLTQDEINDFFSSIADKLDIDEKYLSNDYIRLFIETEDIHNTINQKNIQFKISSINGASSTESPSEIFNLNLRQKLDPASNTFTYQNLNTFDSDLSPSKIIDDQELLKNVNNDVKPTGLPKQISLPRHMSQNSLGNYLNQNESPITNYLNTRFNRIIENRTSPDIDNSYAVHKIIKNDLIPLEREIERGLLLPENTLQHGENYSLTYEKNPQDSKVLFSFAYRINEMNRTRYLEIDYEPSLAEDVVNNRPVPTLNQNPEIEAPTIDTNPIVEEEPFVASLANDFDSYRPSIPASNITPEDIHQKIITYFEKRSSIWDVLGLIRPNNSFPEQDEINDFFSSIADKLDIDEKYLSNDYIRLFIETEDIHNTINQKNIQFKISSINGASSTESPSEIFNLNLRQKLDPASNTFTYQNLNTFDSDLSPSKIIDDQELLKNVNNDVKPTGLPKQISLPRHMSQNSLGNYLNQNESPITNYLNTRFNRIIENRTSPDIDNSYAVHKIIKNDLIPLEREIERDLLLPENTLQHGENYSLTYEKNPQDSKVLFSFAYRINEMNRTRYLEIDYEPSLAEDVVNSRPVPTLTPNQNPEIVAPTIDTNPIVEEEPFVASLSNDFSIFISRIPRENITPEDIHQKIITYFEKRSSIWDVLGLIRPNNSFPEQDELNTFFSSIADKLEIDKKYLSTDYMRLFLESRADNYGSNSKLIHFKIANINSAIRYEQHYHIFHQHFYQELNPLTGKFTYRPLTFFDSHLSPSEIIDDPELLKDVNTAFKTTRLSENINLPTHMSENSLQDYLSSNKRRIEEYLSSRFNRISADIDKSYAVHKIIKNDLIPLEKEIEKDLLLPENTLQHGENYFLTYHKNPQDYKVMFAFNYRINGNTITKNLEIDYNPSLAEDVVNSRPVPTLSPNQNPGIETPTIDTNPIVEEEPFVASLSNDFSILISNIPRQNITPEDIHQKIITYFEKRSSIWDVLGLIRPNNSFPEQDEVNTFFSSIADKLEIDKKYLSTDYMRLFLKSGADNYGSNSKLIQFKIANINSAIRYEQHYHIFNQHFYQELNPLTGKFTYRPLTLFDYHLSPSEIEIIDDQELLKDVNTAFKTTRLSENINLPTHMSENSLQDYLSLNKRRIEEYLSSRFNRISADIDKSYAVHKIIKNDLIPLEKEIEKDLLLPENTLQHGENYFLTYHKNPEDSKVMFAFNYRINGNTITKNLEIDYNPTIEEPFVASLSNDFSIFISRIPPENITPEDIHKKIITYFEKRSSIWDVLGLIRPNNSFPEQDELNTFFSSIADKLEIDKKYLSTDYMRLFLESRADNYGSNSKLIHFKIANINSAIRYKQHYHIFNQHFYQELNPLTDKFTYRPLTFFDSHLSPSEIIDDPELLKDVNTAFKTTRLSENINLPTHMSENSLQDYLSSNKRRIEEYLSSRFNRISADIDKSYAVHKIIKNDLIPLEKEIEKDLLLPENTLQHGENYFLTYHKNPEDSKVMFAFNYRINGNTITKNLEIDYNPTIEEPFVASLSNDYSIFISRIPRENITPEDIHKKIITYFEKRSSIWDVLGLIRPNNSFPEQDELNTFFSSIADKLEIDKKYLSTDYMRLFLKSEADNYGSNSKLIQFKIANINSATGDEQDYDILDQHFYQELNPLTGKFTYQTINTFDSHLSPSEIIDDKELLKDVNTAFKTTRLSENINLPTHMSENSLQDYLSSNKGRIEEYLSSRFNRISADIDKSYAVHKIIKNDLIPLEKEIEKDLLLPENTLQHGENYFLTYHKNPEDSKVMFAFNYRINGNTITKNLEIDYNPTIEEPFVASLSNDYSIFISRIPRENITPEDIHKKIITYFEKRSSIWDVLGLIRPNNSFPEQDELNTFFSSIADKLEIDKKYLSTDYMRLFLKSEADNYGSNSKLIQFKIANINSATGDEQDYDILDQHFYQELNPLTGKFTYQTINTFDSDLSPSEIIDDQELLKNVNNDVKPTGLSKSINLPTPISENSLGNYLNQNESPIKNYLNTRFNRIIENRTSPDIDNSYAVHKIIKNDLIPLEKEIEKDLLLPENTLRHGENYSLTYEKNPEDSKVMFAFNYRINGNTITKNLEIDYNPNLAEDVVIID